MARPPSTDRWNDVLKALEHFPNGASVGELLAVLTPVPTRRSLQRWLAQLATADRVVPEGSARATRYRLAITAAPPPPTPLPLAPPTPSPTITAPELDVSAAAAQVRRYVRQPTINRAPIGYNRTFLDNYRPNKTYYLSESVRTHLREIGSAATPKNQPAGTYARQILDRLLIDLSWNSSRLEGNTYSLLDTERLVARGQVPEGKAALETQMILNHKRAIELLVDQADEIGFNRYTILNLHAILSDNLLPNSFAAGSLRTIPVGIGGSVFLPLDNPPQIEECFDQILATATAIADPFERAFFGMVHLPYLQPFEDVNKRVSRLAANISLIALNISPLSFVDVPQRDYTEGTLGIYELCDVSLLRDVFIWAYERSCARYSAIRQTLGEPDPFRLRYRTQISDTIRQIVQSGRRGSAAAGQVQDAARAIDLADREQFTKTITSELANLHEGNFARYRLRPSEFKLWRESAQ